MAAQAQSRGAYRQLAAIAFLIVLADQLSKRLIALYMDPGQSIAIIDNFLYLTYVRNPGAAFGMLPYQTVFFIVVTVLVSLAIVFFYRTLAAGNRWMAAGLSMQLGGALGNLIDRVSAGYVIDFINFTVWPPVFNVADSAIVLGVALFIVAYWRDGQPRIARS